MISDDGTEAEAAEPSEVAPPKSVGGDRADAGAAVRIGSLNPTSESALPAGPCGSSTR